MKIIEGLKKLKSIKEKLDDLSVKIRTNCAYMDYQTSAYEDPKKQIKSWIDCYEDTVQEYLTLHARIMATNLATPVSIVMSDDTTVTRSIHEWIRRRKEGVDMDMALWSRINDNGLKEGPIKKEVDGEVTFAIATVVRNYDPQERDKKCEKLRAEKYLIDSALEIANATTDLL